MSPVPAADQVLSWVRRPEYTGDNRCLPCTAVNVLIAIALAAAIALVWLPAGLLALALFLAAIALRGYLVPYTPMLTQRYLPDRVLGWFDKADAPEPVASESVADLETVLLDGGVVEECPAGDDLCLTSTFETVWWRRIRQLRDREVARDRLAAHLDIDPEGLSIADQDDGRLTVSYDGAAIGTWDSDAAFYADLAAEPTLSEWLADWDSLGDRLRTQAIAGLRPFLDRCPACETELDTVEDVRKTCCRGDIVTVSVDCPACGALVFNGRISD
ncbi:MAG: hypothetical protein ACOCUO_00540 [archaeon]